MYLHWKVRKKEKKGLQENKTDINDKVPMIVKNREISISTISKISKKGEGRLRKKEVRKMKEKGRQN